MDFIGACMSMIWRMARAGYEGGFNVVVIDAVYCSQGGIYESNGLAIFSSTSDLLSVNHILRLLLRSS